MFRDCTAAVYKLLYTPHEVLMAEIMAFGEAYEKKKASDPRARYSTTPRVFDIALRLAGGDMFITRDMAFEYYLSEGGAWKIRNKLKVFGFLDPHFRVLWRLHPSPITAPVFQEDGQLHPRSILRCSLFGPTERAFYLALILLDGYTLTARELAELFSISTRAARRVFYIFSRSWAV